MRYRCLRRPKTTQERRANGKRNFLDWDEYRVPLRASRNFTNLVENRDDIFRAALRDRSWKKYRKTQWKPLENNGMQAIAVNASASCETSESNGLC